MLKNKLKFFNIIHFLQLMMLLTIQGHYQESHIVLIHHWIQGLIHNLAHEVLHRSGKYRILHSQQDLRILDADPKLQRRLFD